MSNANEVLGQAAELIRRHGWVQRKFGSEGEGFCLVGALIHVGNPSSQGYADAYARVSEELEERTPLAWNDTEGRTQKEVLELLERAARDR